jgi:hypothetical protein
MHWKYANACEKYGTVYEAREGCIVELIHSQADSPGPVQHTELSTKMALGVRFLLFRLPLQCWYTEKVLWKRGSEFGGRIDENIANFIYLLDKYVSTPGSDYKPFDFGRKAHYLTLDVITHIAFGKEFGYLAMDSDLYEYIKTVQESIGAAMMVTVLPWIKWVLQTRLMKRVLPDEKDPTGFRKVLG